MTTANQERRIRCVQLRKEIARLRNQSQKKLKQDELLVIQKDCPHTGAETLLGELAETCPICFCQKNPIFQEETP